MSRFAAVALAVVVLVTAAFVVVVFSLRGDPKPAVVPTELRLPPNPKVGQLLTAFSQMQPVERTAHDGGIVCELYAGRGKKPAWMVNVCYANASPLVPQGHPALAG